jgi:hypothetical protein
MPETASGPDAEATLDVLLAQLDRYPDLDLVDYGFVYHRDPLFPQDDMTWFLLQRT